MKKNTALAGLLLALIFIPSVTAQDGSSLKSQSMNGSTGLYSIPSGHLGWESSGDLGLDIGYRAVTYEKGTAHIPAITISLFKWAEASAAFDFQPSFHFFDREQKNDDLLLGMKFKMPTNTSNPKNPAIALGGNVQIININNNNFNYNAYQPYLAITYAGTFFKMSAETTVVFGKTFYTGGPENNSDIDFGMGFDLILFPDVFGNAVHWITDFANFGYSDNSWPNQLFHQTGSAWYRGILNTGFRIDLSKLPNLSKFKFAVDLVFNDLFDDGSRSFTVGAVFGIPVL